MLPRLVRLHRLLRRVLLPPGFRAEYGEELEATLEARLVGRGRWQTYAVFGLELADLVRTACREWWWVLMAPSVTTGSRGRALVEGSLSDLGLAVRSLSKAPTFTVVSASTLAVAIAANTAIFSVVDAVLIDPLAFPSSDRLVAIAASAPGTDMPEEFGPAPEFYVQYREAADLLESLGMFLAGQFTYRTEQRVERLSMAQAVPSVFDVLGAEPVLGRLPRPEEDMGSVVVLSHSLWSSWFGADSAVIGRFYDIAGAQREVVGVMGPEFRFPDEHTAVWIHGTVQSLEDIRPGAFGFRLVGRMVPGATHQQLAEQLDVLAARLPERVGGSPEYARIIGRHRAIVRSLEADLVGTVSGPLRLLFATVAVVFLIACANLASLFMVRAEGRWRELSVRRTLGAGRWALVRLQMSEAFLVASVGGALGWVLAYGALPAVLRAAPDDVPNLAATQLDLAALSFTAGLSILGAFGFGLYSAIRQSRAAYVGRSRHERHVRARFSRDTLVVAQTGAALVLLIGSGLLTRSYRALASVEPGYDTEGVFTFQLAPERAELTDGPSYARFHDALMERLAALPGVESVGLTRLLPLDEGAAPTEVRTERIRASGAAPVDARYTVVGGEYFRTMGIELIEGRLFAPEDHAGTENVIISSSAADRFWPGEDPIGKRILALPDTTNWKTVVGVVEDILVDDLREVRPEPLIYLPMVGPTPGSWTARSPAYVVKTTGSRSIADDVRQLIRQVVPEAPMYRIYTMEELADRSMALLSFTMLLMAFASGLGLVLGVLGLYGVLSKVASQRAPEIAVRIAVGAEARQVRRMVIVRGARLTLYGLAGGLVIAAAATRLLESLLFGVSPVDAATFLGMSVAMLSVALVASYVPARRASNVDPMQLLRSDDGLGRT